MSCEYLAGGVLRRGVYDFRSEDCGEEGHVRGAVANADERNDLAGQVLRDVVELVRGVRHGPDLPEGVQVLSVPEERETRGEGRGEEWFRYMVGPKQKWTL